MPKADYEAHALTCPDRQSLKNVQINGRNVEEEICDNVTELYISKHVKTEPPDAKFFPFGVMQGPDGAKYS